MIRPRTVAPGVEAFPVRTPTLPPATHTNSYALGEREVLLVEPATPYEDEQRAWVEWARALASAGRSLRAILLTHHHLDHVGGADVLSRALSVPVWAHAETAARVDVPVSRLVDDGDEIALDGPRAARWRVLHTPGHAPGHVCLVEGGQKLAVVGDMVAGEGTILIPPRDQGGDLAQYLAQLERLEGLSIEVALPAHGDPIQDPATLFRRYRRHRRWREERVLAAVGPHAAPGLSAEDLVPAVYSELPESAWPIAALSLRAHLEKLQAEGRVRSLDGVRYSAVDDDRRLA